MANASELHPSHTYCKGKCAKTLDCPKPGKDNTGECVNQTTKTACTAFDIDETSTCNVGNYKVCDGTTEERCNEWSGSSALSTTALNCGAEESTYCEWDVEAGTCYHLGECTGGSCVQTSACGSPEE